MGSHDVPRRICIDKFTPAERAIYDAVQAVDAMPADTRLTDAIVLLGQARDAVADFVDGAPRRESDYERGRRSALEKMTLPNREGWWVRRRDGRLKWFRVELSSETGAPPYTPHVYDSDRNRMSPVTDMSAPGCSWYGPVVVPADE